MSSCSPALLSIDLAALQENYRLFKNMTQASVAGIVKANAYGTGAKEVFNALRAEGCHRFFVATPEEAMELRQLDTAAEIMVLGGVYKGAEAECRAANLTPVLNSIEDIERWATHARHGGEALPAVLHIDTGMNRLGIRPEEAERASAMMDGINLRMVMSHFAGSEDDVPMNGEQAERFAKSAAFFPSVPKSLCNSSGLFRNKDWHYDVVRPGYALYGGNPTPGTINPMRRVVDYSVRILQSRQGIKGESAGYNATHVFEKDTNLATVSLGYADGFLRGGSNRAKLYHGNRPCPIVGRISMDLIIVDVGDAPVQEGEWLEVLGQNQSVDDLAADCGTIGYEILTSLRHRAQRLYRY